MKPCDLNIASGSIGARERLSTSRNATSAKAPAIAAAGVDLLSVGWLTHSATVLDIGLDHRA